MDNRIARSANDLAIKHLAVLTILTVASLFCRQPALAQNGTGIRCERLFSDEFEIPRSAPYTSGLSAQKLKEAHLVMEGDRLIDVTDGKHEVIGKIKVLNAKYLFQWSDQATHHFLKTRGMDPEWMKEILNGKGQKAGKGFYVSLHPTDSASYSFGHDAGLTVFKIERPLIILEATTQSIERLKVDTPFVYRMKNLGVDALTYTSYNSTWLSIIQESQLKTQVPFPAEVLSFVNRKADDGIDTFYRYLKATTHEPDSVLKALSPKDSFRKLVNLKNLNLSDVETLGKNIKSLRSFDEKTQNHFIDQIFRLLKSVRKPGELLALTKAISLIPDERANWVASQYSMRSSASAQTQVYNGILEIFDASVVARLAPHSPQDAVADLGLLKSTAQRYVTEKSKVDLKKITSLDQLLKTAEKVFGIQYKFRKDNAFMSDGSKPIEVTPRAYQTLKSNRFLTVKDIDEPVAVPGNRRIYVRYCTPSEIDKSFYPSSVYATTFRETTRMIRERIQNGSDATDVLPAFFAEAVESILNKSIISDLREFSDDPSSFRNPENLYRIFEALHPFEDGNGRLGRFIYEILTAQDPLLQKPNFLNLLAFDFDLTLSRNELKNQIIVGTLLNNWILQAKDDAEFILRARWAVEIFSRVYPELRAYFPDIQPIP
jgi:hypothetical protein